MSRKPPSRKTQPKHTSQQFRPALRATVTFVFLWFFVRGIARFAFTESKTETEMGSAVLVSVVLELLGAVGLLWPPTRRLSA